MRPKSSQSSSESLRTFAPALTPEARENQLIALAYDRTEQRIRDGTASSQELVHFLKLGSTKEKLEKEILEKQKDLMDAKTYSLQSAQKYEELCNKAMEAFKSYSGADSDEEDYSNVL